jgi:hypothetical protein
LALALETWDDLHERLGLMALGYRRVLYCELFCISCGDWRGVLEQELDTYECPSCRRPSKISIICEKAFTRQPEIPWEQVAKPLSATFRKLIMMNNAFDEGYQRRPTKQPDRHRRKARTVAARGFAEISS